MEGTVTNTEDIAVLKDAFETAAAAIKTNTLAMLAVALVGGLAIFGVICATKSGIKFLRNLISG